MRILVLGGCGFIGSHVVDWLVTAGHDVRVLSRRAEALRLPVPGVDYHLSDCRDGAAVSAALEGRDCVVHAYSATMPGNADADPAADVSANLLPLIDLLDRIDRAGVGRMVFLSSGGMVYGTPASVPINEREPLRPSGSYGIVKVAMESYIALRAHDRGLRTVILRPSNVYGQRQGRDGAQGLVNTLLRRALTGERVEIWGDGSVIKDYLNVADLARLCLMAVESHQTGIFNAGSGIGRSVREVIDLVQDVTGRQIDVTYGTARSVDSPANILDVTAARQTFGWTPSIGLRDGLMETWAWHQAQALIPA
ncbi:MAG: NAD-dependent epimerase/dehydratase family protein [Tabrizicola sp.]|jgi:UDP-glucose 4-epimerase|nr:NAD-dependent epimerase/dehydratase family protein [Tabrizicola sp.]